MNCPICNKKGRHDNIVRHIASHKKEIPSIMKESNIAFCAGAKMPILYLADKCMYCLICRKYALSPVGINSMRETYTYLHKQCMKQFDTVSKHYVVPEKNAIVFDDATPKPLPAAAPPAELETMKKRIADLESELKEAEENAKEALEDSAMETKRKDHVTYLLERLKTSVIAILPPTFDSALLGAIDNVLYDDDWDVE
jgi:hypothetical protein